eukprot:Tbor_TRINITY_DN6650_c0_g1::TRINITY_DN6650_c0_g1_i1::g.3106::m.3106
MDQEHDQHLSRILANRRRRGVSAADRTVVDTPKPIMSPSPQSYRTPLLSPHMPQGAIHVAASVRPADGGMTRACSSIPHTDAAVRSASTSSSTVYFSPPQILKTVQLTANKPNDINVVNPTVGNRNYGDGWKPSGTSPTVSPPGQSRCSIDVVCETRAPGKGGAVYSSMPIEDRRGVSVTIQPQNRISSDKKGESTHRSLSTAADGLFAKGKFENFRRNPVLVSTNIRPYRSSSQPIPPQMGGIGMERSASVRNTNDNDRITTSVIDGPPIDLTINPFNSSNSIIKTVPIASPISSKNPFRRQTFEEFKSNPEYGPPKDFVSASCLPAVSAPVFEKITSTFFHDHSPHKLVGPLCIHDDTPENTIPSPKRAVVASRGGAKGPVPPLFDMGKCLVALSKGDWFLKWTRNGKVHKRFFRLEQNNSTLVWSSSPDSVVDIISRSCFHLGDITGIQPQCIVDEESNRTVYKIHITTNERFLHIGTEMRDKFDIWVDTLQRLSAAIQHDMQTRGLTLATRHARYTTPKVRPDREVDRYLHRIGRGDE